MGNATKKSCIKSIEWAWYEKWGNITIACIQCTTGTISGNEEILFTGLPKAAIYHRFTALAIDTSGNYYPIRLGIDAYGQISNGYTPVEKLSNANITLNAVYISA